MRTSLPSLRAARTPFRASLLAAMALALAAVPVPGQPLADGPPSNKEEAPAAPSAPAAAPAASSAREFGFALEDELKAAFDARRSFADLERQVAMGPRVPGTPAWDQCKDWLEGELAAAGLRAERQEFGVRDEMAGGVVVVGTNFIARWRPEAPRQVLLTCHWDCRRFADRDPNPALRRQPVDGANDGASGVSVLLEVARALQARPLPPGLGVMFVFFDLEDQGTSGPLEDFCLGSSWFADNFDHSIDVAAAINLDMVGDADLSLGVEGNSEDHAPEVVDALWSHGEALFPNVFHRGGIGTVFDDHVRLQRVGLPAIDVIDFSYAPWHTARDLPEHCSPESLRAVGETLLAFLAHEARPRPR